MNKTLKSIGWRWAMRATALALCLTASAKSINAYLPIVGVPPLRFWVVTTNEFNYSRFEAELAKVTSKPPLASQTDTNAMIGAMAGTNDVTLLAQSPAPMAQTMGNQAFSRLDSQQSVPEMEKDPGQKESFAFPGTTASDLLTVTPQMIAQYLKPDPNATNSLDRPGAVVFIPADMPFTPPIPKGTPESQAKYHSP
jgi:hypothetical protein